MRAKGKTSTQKSDGVTRLLFLPLAHYNVTPTLLAANAIVFLMPQARWLAC
jgi:hypothetical protein